MGKKKRDRYRVPLKSDYREVPSSSGSEVHPEATTGPGELRGPSTGLNWARDSTNAPEIGEEALAGEAYAQSTSALIDKYILSKEFVPFTLLVVGIGVIFIQDNQAGSLKTLDDLLWTIVKCGALFVLFLMMLFFQWIYKKT